MKKGQTPGCLPLSSALCCSSKSSLCPHPASPRALLLPCYCQNLHYCLTFTDTALPRLPWHTGQACCCPSHQNARYLPLRALCRHSLQPGPAVGIGRSHGCLQRVSRGVPGNQAPLSKHLPPQAAAEPAFPPTWPKRAA